MRKVIKTRLAGMVCGALAMAGSQSAWALDKYLDLDPAETLSGYGYGYDSIARSFILKQCVAFGNGRIDDSGGQSGDVMDFSAVSSNDKLAQSMGLSVAAKFSTSMGVGSVSTSGKMGFFQSTKTDMHTLTILASYSDVEPVKYIAGDINLKPEYLAMVGKAEFRQSCGDYVIIGEQSGRWFYGTVQLTAKDTTTESRLSAKGTVDGSWITMKASASVSTVNQVKEASSNKDLDIHVTSSGTKNAALGIDEFLKQVREFPGQKNGPKQVYKLKAVPYEKIVANWPPSNPLAPITDEQRLEAVINAAYGLQALSDDSDFVIHNATLFAMGTTPAKREARLNHVKARRAWYERQLTEMRNQGKTCDVKWKDNPACEQLYEKWKTFDDWAADEYAQFPWRYTSDCYTPRDVSPHIASSLGIALKNATGNWNRTLGDPNMGGGPVYFSAFLRFKPNFNGGNLAATRTLYSELSMRMEENKADHSSFEYTAKVPETVDLTKPFDITGGGGAPVSFDQCAYKGTGVRSPNFADMGACEMLKSQGMPQQVVDFCKKEVLKEKFQGSIHGTTASGAQSANFDKNAHGVISSMACTVDNNTSDATKAIGCTSINLTAIQLDLTNTADTTADAWQAPKDPNSQATPKGDNPNPKYVAAIKASRVAKVKAKPVVTNCKPGLVSVGGACVPQLKR